MNTSAENTLDQLQPWDKGDALVLQPEEGESYWQPKPVEKASGFGPKIGD